MKKFPLESLYPDVMKNNMAAPVPGETAISEEIYLDIAERIVRHLVQWQHEDGMLIDPYSPYKIKGEDEFFSSARLAGAIGLLIKAGRCGDLRDSGIKATDCCLSNLNKYFLSPEFWIKELIYSWEALADFIPSEKRESWQRSLTGVKPEKYYNCIKHNYTNNQTAFVILGEFLRYKAGLTEDISIIDKLLEQQLGNGLFSSYGLYKEPEQPLTYSFVVNQQMDFLLHAGYQGRFLDELKEISRRAGFTAMLMQSVTGQAPFGGRSNQYHFVEGHLACFFETRADFCHRNGDFKLAGMYRRSARNALKSVIPWISGQETPKLMKNKFPDRIAHGIDSGGTYTVYLALTASLFATAYHLAGDSIREVPSPAETGGFVFELQEGFHKIFANCGGHYLEIDTKAEVKQRKEATGLGRIHKYSVPGELLLSSSIVANPDYTIGTGIELPDRNLALGPCWKNAEGKEFRLADYSDEIERVQLNIIREDADKTVFSVLYEGNFNQINRIRENYELTPEKIKYEFELEHFRGAVFVTVPLLETNGLERTEIKLTSHGFELWLNNHAGIIENPEASSVTLLKDAALANKTGRYKTGMISGNSVTISLF
ncbi:MAG: hypothetical protein PHV82_13230 [Victivallaceae bacterium]|nr:hypothetical protein [Victivallaceae bacterium]